MKENHLSDIWPKFLKEGPSDYIINIKKNTCVPMRETKELLSFLDFSLFPNTVKSPCTCSSICSPRSSC